MKIKIQKITRAGEILEYAEVDSLERLGEMNDALRVAVRNAGETANSWWEVFKAKTIEEVEEGMGATFCGYSDAEPFEVVSKTRCTVKVRAMSAKLDPSWKPNMHPGGFAAHTSNNDSQKWILSSNLNGRIEVLRLTKRGWHGRMGRFVIGYARKFYDYNF